MKTTTPLDLARKHVGNGAAMESSARLCLADAVRHNDSGNLKQAEQHALKSLAYSVGLFHADYAKAWRMVHGSEFPCGSRLPWISWKRGTLTNLFPRDPTSAPFLRECGAKLVYETKQIERVHDQIRRNSDHP